MPRSRKSDKNIEAIRYFSKAIRKEIHDNGGEPITKDSLGGILDESPCDIDEFIRQKYAPQPMRNFLDAHPEVFLIYGSGCLAEVDVASKKTVSDYVNSLYDVLRSVCSPYGNVLRIVIFRKNGVQAMVEFDSIDSACNAKESLNGANIYSGCCTLKILFAKTSRLNVYKNDNESWDYTNPGLGKPDNVTIKGGNTNSKDKAPSRTADQSKLFGSSNMKETTKLLHDIPTFQTKPGFNCSSDMPIKSDKTNVTFVEANYRYNDFTQDLFSKTILNSDESNEDSKHRNIECQTISSGKILISQLYQ